MRIRRPVGIDLGTTNSCVGVMNAAHDGIVLSTLPSGTSTTPSCVWYDERTNEVVVGSDAYVRRGAEPPPVVSVKRSMGKLVLVPLGKAGSVPANLPAGVRRALTETRDQRLQRFLARLEAATDAELQAVRQKKAAEPPLLWVMDQAARMQSYLSGLTDAGARAQAQRDPPLLWLPEEVSALILAEERRQIQSRQRELEPALTHVVDRCVITVPAYFGAEQMEATKEAGVLAGLEVLELLQEPTAAAVYYCWKAKIESGLFLVFDLGGGTFDVSVLRKQGAWSQVLGISGDSMLGGDDFDRALADLIRRTVAKASPRYDLDLQLDRPADKAIWEGLVFMAEGVKKALSRESSYLLRDTTCSDRNGVRLNIDMTITRAQLEQLMAPLVDRCVAKCWEALARAALKADVSLAEVDHVFLVGGATHVPYVQRVVQGRFCSRGALDYGPVEIDAVVEEIAGDDAAETAALRARVLRMLTHGERARCESPMLDVPDLCVALGAAVQAAAHGEEVQSDRATVTVTSPRGTSDPSTTIAGKVSSDESLVSASVTLVSAPLAVDLEEPVAADGSFTFDGVPLGHGENRFELALLDAGGDELARADLTIARVSSGVVRPVQGAAPTVARAYALDVIRHGVVSRRQLVPSGASLPVDRCTHELAVPDPNSGVILFKVFQGSRLLKQIEAFVDLSVRPGTPIVFTFSIGRDHMMRATYQIAGDPDEHPVIIEPPDSLKPAKGELDTLITLIVQELEYVDPLRRASFALRLDKLTESARQAQEMADDAKLIDRFEQLQGLHQEILREKIQLQPPRHEFEKSCGVCLAILEALQQVQPDYPADEHRRNLRAVAEAGRAAYAEKAQDRYAECVERVRLLREALSRDYHRKAEADVPPVKRAEEMIDQGIEGSRKLREAADAAISVLDRQFKDERDPEVRQRLMSHVQQCRECRDNVAACHTGFQELKATYTSNPKAAMEKCYEFFPILANAANVLETKQVVAMGKPETTGSLPWEQ